MRDRAEHGGEPQEDRLGDLDDRGLIGGIDIKKKEATVTLSVVDTRTTEEVALTQGYYRKTDIGFGAAGG